MMGERSRTERGMDSMPLDVGATVGLSMGK
jgi:hypothetical protein